MDLQKESMASSASGENSELDDIAVDELWSLYKNSNDIDAKNELLLHYLHIVRKLVRRMMPRYNAYNEYDDLVSCGVIGLIDAVEKFDLRHGVRFETYAVQRVRGEIIDYMRSQDWAPSSLRKKITQINNASEELEARYGKPPSDELVAQTIDMTVQQVRKIQSQTQIFNVLNFEETISGSMQQLDMSASEEQQPETILMNKDMKDILVQLIEELPQKERLVITLYYFEELMLKEIAEIMGVSESRVSQIHSKVLAKFKTKLGRLL